MSKKKQILAVVLSTLLSVGLVAAGVSAATTVGNNVDIGGTLDVASDLDVGGYATITATTGLIQTQAEVVAGGIIHAITDLEVGGNATITAASGNLDLDGDLLINSNATITNAGNIFTDGTLDVAGIADISGDLDVGGYATITATTGLIQTQAEVVAGGIIHAITDLEVGGNATITAASGNITIDGDLVLGTVATITAEGRAVINGDLLIGGSASITSDGVLVMTATSTMATTVITRLDANKLIVGAGQQIKRYMATSAGLDVQSVVATTCADVAESIELAGTAAADTIIATPRDVANGITRDDFSMTWMAYASGTDQITLRVCNFDSHDINLDAQQWNFDVWQH